MKKRVLYITCSPSPYRMHYFNILAKDVDLTVWFEQEKERYESRNDKWNTVDREGFTRVNKLSFKSFCRYDFVVICGISTPIEIKAILYCKIKGIPYFLETDGAFIKDKESIVKNKVKTILTKGAEGYFCSGNYTKKTLMYYGANEEKIHLFTFTSLLEKDIISKLPNQQEKEMLRRKYNLSNNSLICVSVGQFIKRKGFDVLLKGAALLPEIRFYIIGDKPTAEYLEYVKSFKINNAHFLDFMEKQDLLSFYKACDFFVFPTREDIWGLVINEAMACGLPIVSSNRSIAALELVRDGVNGFIFNSECVDEMVAKLERIVCDSALRHKMAETNIALSKNNTIEKMVADHLAVFNA